VNSDNRFKNQKNQPSVGIPNSAKLKMHQNQDLDDCDV
jgi:hypothetical protein